MTEELKYQIVAGAKEYALLKKLSNTDVARLANINDSYVSNMFRNQFINIVAGKETPIGDKWFYALAEWAALPVKKQYWATIPTPQFIEVISCLENAKKSSRISVIVC